MSAETSAGSGPQPRIAVAYAWMVGALLSFLTMAIATREASFTLSAAETLFYRGLIGIGICLVLAQLSAGGFAALKTQRLPAHIVRNVFQFGGQYAWFYAIAVIPLAQVFALEFTVPLWMAALAPFLLKERVTWRRAASLIVGFVGVLIVVRPHNAGISEGAIAMLFGAVGFALGLVYTKRLSSSDSPLAIIFYMTSVQSVLSFPIALMGALTLPDAWTCGLLLLVTSTGLSAHYCLAQAFSRADALAVAPMDFLRLPLVMLAGILLYGEPFDLWVIVGGAVVLGGNLINMARTAKRA